VDNTVVALTLCFSFGLCGDFHSQSKQFKTSGGTQQALKIRLLVLKLCLVWFVFVREFIA
jgi:hypothetical protein